MTASASPPIRKRRGAIRARVAQALGHALPERLPLGARIREVAARREDDRDDGEARRVDAQRGRDAERVDEQSAERGAADARRGEADVEERVSLSQQAFWLQHGVHRSARDASRGEHQGAVEEREQQHRDEREGLREQRERREDERLAQVDRGEDLPELELVDMSREHRRDERGEELRGDEERGRRERVLGLAVDEQSERDEPDVVADRVRRVREKQPAEGRHAKGFQISPDGRGEYRSSRRMHRSLHAQIPECYRSEVLLPITGAVTRNKRVLVVGQGLLLGGSVTAGALLSDREDWQPQLVRAPPGRRRRQAELRARDEALQGLGRVSLARARDDAARAGARSMPGRPGDELRARSRGARPGSRGLPTCRTMPSSRWSAGSRSS